LILFLRNQNFLICLVGLPSSGKSKFANSLKIALKKKYNDLDVKIIDPDLIRQRITPDKFNHNKEHLVRNKNLQTIRSELEKKKIVISDDLNYYSSMRHDLKNIADILNIHFFIIHIATPIEICLKWNEERGKPIPNEVISKIQDKFDKFNRYYWDHPTVSYNLSDILDIDQAIKEFLAKLEDKMIPKNQKLRTEGTKIVSNIFNENLDKITRIYVGKLIINPNYLALKNKIIKLRKNYVKKNKNKALSEVEIVYNFKNYLEKSLNIKISGNFN